MPVSHQLTLVIDRVMLYAAVPSVPQCRPSGWLTLSPCRRQLGQALEFLHSDVKLLHRNVCPESVVINRAGAWKLAGFEFCQANTAAADQPVRAARRRRGRPLNGR